MTRLTDTRIGRGALAMALTAFLLLAPWSDCVARAPSGVLQGDSRAQAYLHYSVGRLMEIGGALTEALVQYRRADTLDPDQCDLKAAIARTLYALGRAEEAASISTEAVELCPGSDEALALHGEILLASGRSEEAARTLEPRAHEHKAPRVIASLYAQALLSQDRFQEGEAYLLTRTRIDSLDADAASLLARTFLMLDDPDSAAREFRRAVRLDPDDRRSLGMLSRLLISMERPEEGVPMLERLLSEYDGLELEFVTLATGYSMLGEMERAHAVLDSAETRFGRTEAIQGARGAAYFNEGRHDLAMNAYESLLELNPDSVLALNFVAYTLADEGRDLDRALRYAERAALLDEANPLVRDTLGWTYFRLGRAADARVELERAVELDPDNPILHDHLGDVLAGLGLAPEACESWKEALRLSPGDEQILGKLERACAGEDPHRMRGDER